LKKERQNSYTTQFNRPHRSDSRQPASAKAGAVHGAALRDPLLRDDDGVVDAYDEAIEAVCDWHDALDVLADCVLEIEADHGGAGSPAFDSADDLIAALRR
jgi:hypothetical protein